MLAKKVMTGVTSPVGDSCAWVGKAAQAVEQLYDNSNRYPTDVHVEDLDDTCSRIANSINFSDFLLGDAPRKFPAPQKTNVTSIHVDVIKTNGHKSMTHPNSDINNVQHCRPIRIFLYIFLLTMTAPFSCDLVPLARQHKWFLRTIHSLGISLEKPSLESLRRYRNLWLPLVASNQEQELIPPPDVAWLWHCHRLAPNDYNQYVKQHFGGILEANPPFALQTELTDAGTMLATALATRRIWEEMYPDDPFFLDKKEVSIQAEQSTSLGGFDLLGSAERQASFLWQVSGDRFDDQDFLQEAVDKYHKFLLLKPKAKGIILVPTYQIDLMWHTHILTSLTHYSKDCNAIMGSPLHHDDSLTDRSEGGVLDVSYRATKHLWQQEFGEKYVVEGGMYRGEPPVEYHRQDWHQESFFTAVEETLHLVGKMGASSTGVTEPTRWAVVGGTTSTGEVAFLPTNTQRKRDLAGLPKKDNYVLGKTSHGVGFYHLETKEAHVIMIKRMTSQTRKMESDLACDRCLSCGGSGAAFEARERKLEESREALAVMVDRLEASKPSGSRGRRNKNNNNNNSGGDSAYYDSTGAWLYPAYVWDAGGGACGGDVACSGGGCGGSACGGGGCGGGGCGGGGCGGGGCGGGG